MPAHSETSKTEAKLCLKILTIEIKIEIEIESAAETSDFFYSDD